MRGEFGFGEKGRDGDIFFKAIFFLWLFWGDFPGYFFPLGSAMARGRFGRSAAFLGKSDVVERGRMRRK